MKTLTTKFVSMDKTIEISVRQLGKFKIAWTLHIDGKYQGSKVLPANNTAIVQNFGFLASDFVEMA